MATNPSGSASARQRIRFRRPMPGSIRIATAPALNSPNTSEMKSIPGRTSKASRTPGSHAQLSQSPGDPVAVPVQLAKGELPIPPLAAGVVAQRLDHGNRLGHGLGGRPSAGRRR